MREFTPLQDGNAFQEILYVKKDGVATITLNRPQNYNAYSTKTLRELARAFEDAGWDDRVAVVVYTGSGDKSFCTGGDVKEYAEDYVKRPRDYWKYMSLFRAYLEGIMHCPKPVIARINGMAAGGGNESQLACDLAVIAEHAWVGQVGTSVGSVACGGATQWLPLVVGDRRAREMLMMNPKISAKKALEWGLVNAVAPSVTKDGAFIEGASEQQIRLAQDKKEGYAIDLSRLDAKIAEYVANLKDKFPECLRYTKIQTNQGKEAVWHATVGHAQDWLALHFTSPEPQEGMRAFAEKRKTDWGKMRSKWANDESPEYPYGAPMASCPSCGAKGLPLGFKFCGACGHGIAAK
ncbi:MAG: enoyl-CoA hydratase/isomerase family protein [Planctomycetes bacterium]|nr:enoyl-CoA hydratase/isomerase family protein [Planctomycetota bacterium]